MANRTKVYISWKDVEEYIERVCLELDKQHFRAAGVYGPPRGGLVFAVMLSHRLHIPLLMCPSSNCIIVDDVADTGRSLYHYKPNENMLIDTFFVTTMYYNAEKSLVKPDYWMNPIKNNQWIVFPWENRED